MGEPDSESCQALQHAESGFLSTVCKMGLKFLNYRAAWRAECGIRLPQGNMPFLSFCGPNACSYSTRCQKSGVDKQCGTTNCHSTVYRTVQLFAICWGISEPAAQHYLHYSPEEAVKHCSCSLFTWHVSPRAEHVQPNRQVTLQQLDKVFENQDLPKGSADLLMLHSFPHSCHNDKEEPASLECHPGAISLFDG